MKKYLSIALAAIILLVMLSFTIFRLGDNRGVAARKIYVIQKGDTLHKICQTQGAKLSDVIKENPGLNPGRLQVGQELIIPRARKVPENPGNPITQMLRPKLHCVAPS